jgi:hypothetical protein
MKHVLAPTREGSMGKVVITDDWVTAIEGVIDPVVFQSLNRAMGKRSKKQNLWIL